MGVNLVIAYGSLEWDGKGGKERRGLLLGDNRLYDETAIKMYAWDCVLWVALFLSITQKHGITLTSFHLGHFDVEKSARCRLPLGYLLIIMHVVAIHLDLLWRISSPTWLAYLAAIHG